MPPASPSADGDYAAFINEMEARSFSGVLGLRFTRATADEVLAELPISARHHQPYGVVHGGVYASIIETLASVGAGVSAFAYNKTVLGLENHTSFLRAVRQGTLHAKGTPLSRGRRAQVWEVAIHDDEGRLVATGRVRLLLLEADAQVAGMGLAFANPPAVLRDAQGQPATPTDDPLRSSSAGSAVDDRGQGKGDTP